MKKWGTKEVGVYADSARGFGGTLHRVINIAVSEGMPEPTDEDIKEFPDDVWNDAEDWLNEHLAKEGYYFGSTEQGDWGYFPIEEE